MKKWLISLLAFTIIGCSAANVVPVPAGKVPCGSEYDCPLNVKCAFNGINTHATCQGYTVDSHDAGPHTWVIQQ